MDFIPVEEAQHSSEVQWGVEEKEAKDFVREEWVEEPGIIMLLAGLEGAVALMDREEVLEVEEATLGEVVGIMRMTPVEEGEDPIILERISKMNAVIKQLDMVR